MENEQQVCRAPRPGISGRKRWGCDCPQCCEAVRSYTQRRDRLIAAGRWQPYVDASRARAHVQALVASGVTMRSIMCQAGVTRSTVRRLLGRDPSRRPIRRLRPEAEAAFLQVTSDLGAHALVPALGTRRRAHALLAIGWSLTSQAQMLGYLPSAYRRMLRQTRLQRRTTQSVASLFDQLWDRPAAGEQGKRMRRWAAQRGYAPAMAWDDIDDPDAEPQGVRGEPPAPEAVRARDANLRAAICGERGVRLGRGERAAAVVRMHMAGVSPAVIASRLKTTVAAVHRWLADEGLEREVAA